MPVIEFAKPKDRTYQSGLDKAVLYVEDGPVVPWNGLQKIDDAGSSETRTFYQDGVQYLSYVTPRNWAGSLTCVTYPPELDSALGLGIVGDGFYADSQVPTRFSISYRTLITTPDIDTKQHYKIHLVYKCMASVQGFSYETLTSSGADPIPFQFDLSATPVAIPMMRPTAHLIFDSRDIDEASMAALEKILYGSPITDPRLPTITELIELLRFSDNVVIVDNGNGTWSATGKNTNVDLIDDPAGYFQLNNAAATAPDVNGKYVLTVTP